MHSLIDMGPSSHTSTVQNRAPSLARFQQRVGTTRDAARTQPLVTTWSRGPSCGAPARYWQHFWQQYARPSDERIPVGRPDSCVDPVTRRRRVTEPRLLEVELEVGRAVQVEVRPARAAISRALPIAVGEATAQEALRRSLLDRDGCVLGGAIGRNAQAVRLAVRQDVCRTERCRHPGVAR